ncbi:hypothetical protein ACFS07_30000 [Undibacterium arcticum]
MSNTRVLNEVADLSAGNTAIDASTADLLTISGAANTATFVVASGMGEVINSAHEFKDRIDISTTAGGFGSEFSTPSSILFRSLMQKKSNGPATREGLHRPHSVRLRPAVARYSG